MSEPEKSKFWGRTPPYPLKGSRSRILGKKSLIFDGNANAETLRDPIAPKSGTYHQTNDI